MTYVRCILGTIDTRCLQQHRLVHAPGAGMRLLEPLSRVPTSFKAVGRIELGKSRAERGRGARLHALSEGTCAINVDGMV